MASCPSCAPATRTSRLTKPCSACWWPGPTFKLLIPTFSTCLTETVQCKLDMEVTALVGCSAKRLKQAPDLHPSQKHMPLQPPPRSTATLLHREFLGSPDVVSKLRVASEVLHLQDGHPLSPQDLEFLSASLLKCSSSTSKHSCQQQDRSSSYKDKKEPLLSQISMQL